MYGWGFPERPKNSHGKSSHLAPWVVVLILSAKMSFFKKNKKFRQPSRQAASLGIPTHIALGPLGIGVDLDPESGSEGSFRSVKSANRWGVI